MGWFIVVRVEFDDTVEDMEHDALSNALQDHIFEFKTGKRTFPVTVTQEVWSDKDIVVRVESQDMTDEWNEMDLRLP